MIKISLNAFDYSVREAKDGEKWYVPYLEFAQDNGISEGNKPNEIISRGEALQILIDLAKFSNVDAHFQQNYESKEGWWYVGFKDVLMKRQYAKYVAFAKDFDIVSGYEDGSFGPERNITRAEIAKIVIRILEIDNN